MAASNLLTLIDDIASLLDDVSVMTKMAAKKTAGVLGDDLALNAQQVSGIRADRELPVVWAVAKGSLLNKAILVPTALLISSLLPSAILPLLMLGGVFLCFEGFEKLAHRWLPHSDKQAENQSLKQALEDPSIDIVAYEKDKIKGAIRTDFILSAEIIVITLGTVTVATLTEQVLVLSSMALLMTVGVYGLVAGIVKLDDAGIYLSQRASSIARTMGHGLLQTAPLLMKGLSIAGTAAMFLVGGGILSHGIPPLHHANEALTHVLGATDTSSSLLVSLLFDALIGVVAGGLVLLAVTLGKKLLTLSQSTGSR
ncbi:DUF808 domain-containing protein [Methylobacillus gramineus]|uniref:DUF808 domain-containing protein n=1 Tax=Methylobacillus gramineus TaxID=755169 RepID=UPI001CFFDFA7|nr:DUF808 domain-containing protein [Methylobacillus gramineus]MCB5186267.1 DUF808 domain-containing protein [Methylobacillus gramineus]